MAEYQNNEEVAVGEEEVENDESLGCCEGEDSLYVKIISSDGHEFIIERKYALISGTMRAMLDGPGQSYSLSIISLQRPEHLFNRYFFKFYVLNIRIIFYYFSSFGFDPT